MRCKGRMERETMSYCVNCGVELDKTAKECALCNTPVMNPREVIAQNAKTPFPEEKQGKSQICPLAGNLKILRPCKWVETVVK